MQQYYQPPYGGFNGYVPPAPGYAPPLPYDPREREYKALRRHSIGVGLCLIGYFVLEQMLVFFLSASGLYSDYLDNPAFQYAFGAVFFTLIALGLPFFLMSLKKGSPSYIGVLPFNAPKEKGKTFYVVAVGFMVCILANFAATFAQELFSGFGIEMVETPETVSATAFDVALNFLGVAIVPALVEEFVFRGVIMQPLRRYGDNFAVVATAFIFGLAHGSPVNFVFAFIAGLAMGYAVVLTGSIWAGVMIHFCNNFFAVAVSELYNLFPDMSQIPYYITVFLIVALGIGGLAALLILRAFKFSGGSSGLTHGRRFRGFFLSVPMLAAFAFLLYYISLSIE